MISLRRCLRPRSFSGWAVIPANAIPRGRAGHTPLSDWFDLARPPGLVEERLERVVEAEDRNQPLPGTVCSQLFPDPQAPSARTRSRLSRLRSSRPSLTDYRGMATVGQFGASTEFVGRTSQPTRSGSWDVWWQRQSVGVGTVEVLTVAVSRRRHEVLRADAGETHAHRRRDPGGHIEERWSASSACVHHRSGRQTGPSGVISGGGIEELIATHEQHARTTRTRGNRRNLPRVAAKARRYGRWRCRLTTASSRILRIAASGWNGLPCTIPTAASRPSSSGSTAPGGSCCTSSWISSQKLKSFGIDGVERHSGRLDEAVSGTRRPLPSGAFPARRLATAVP